MPDRPGGSGSSATNGPPPIDPFGTVSQIVKMEACQAMPQLDEAVRLVEALHVPLQHLLTGKSRPATDLKGIAYELHDLGIRDFVVSDAAVPGAWRSPTFTIPA